MQSIEYQNLELYFENFRWRNLFNFPFLVFNLNIRLRDGLQKLRILGLLPNVEVYLSLLVLKKLKIISYKID